MSTMRKRRLGHAVPMPPASAAASSSSPAAAASSSSAAAPTTSAYWGSSDDDSTDSGGSAARRPAVAVEEEEPQWWPPSVAVSKQPMTEACHAAICKKATDSLADTLGSMAQPDGVHILRLMLDSGALSAVLDLLLTTYLRQLSQCSAALWWMCRDTMLERRGWGMYHPSMLTEQQSRIVAAALRGDNLFVTGGAGTGKSYVQMHICAWLRFEGRIVVQAAPTGAAAVQMNGGVTLHSLIGANPDMNLRGPPMINMNKRAALARATTCVLDEISMCSPDLWTYTDKCCRVARRHMINPLTQASYDREPFGGLQMLVFGDYLQLPPIVDAKADVQFVFETDLWKRMFSPAQGNCYELEQSLRQNQAAFCWALHQMRYGRSKCQFMRRFFRSCIVAERNLTDYQRLAVSLHARNAVVDRVNHERTVQLDVKTRRLYYARSFGEDEALTANCQAPDELDLRVGSRVMLLRNIDARRKLVNGMCGTVVAFKAPRYAPEVLGSSYQDPHVSLDDELKWHLGADSVRFDKPKFRVAELPVVHFDCGVTAALMPLTFDLKKEKRRNAKNEEVVEYLAVRVQLPLRLAWALSIHKSQGTTLHHCRVSLNDIFAPGQGYVAFSRCSDAAALIITNDNWDAVKADARALRYYEQLFGKPRDVPEHIRQAVMQM
jgi:ATP-dependent DNA helicase PIF1